VGSPIAGPVEHGFHRSGLAIGGYDVWLTILLDMGFLPDMQHLIGLAPKNRQLLCFSATTNPKSTRLFEDMLTNPVTVSVLAKKTSKHIHQDVIKGGDNAQKLDRLVDLLGEDQYGKVLVFGETKHGVRKLATKLTERGFNSASIHGNKSQKQRQRALDQFKSNHTPVLVATDVAARGLDVPNVDLVVNYDEPNDHDTYIHRIGRTGRAGESGHARTFI
jgi:superfamily II DNA/RNA helicase